MDFIFSIRNYYKKKTYTKYFAFADIDKYKVVKRKPADRKYWVRPAKDRYWWETFASIKVVEKEWRKSFRMSRETFKFFAQNYILIFLRITPGFKMRSLLLSKLL